MKRFFNSPWPLVVVMTIGTAVALATSISFIAENETVKDEIVKNKSDPQVDATPSAQLSGEKRQP